MVTVFENHSTKSLILQPYEFGKIGNFGKKCNLE